MKKFLFNSGLAAIMLLTFACRKSIPVKSLITDVYVSGDSSTTGFNSVVKYWKNGIAVDCSDGTTQASPYSMAVSGSDVYMAGYLKEGAYYTAMEWKNRTGFRLSTPSSYGTSANSVKVSGNDVYYGGCISPYAGSSVATYWKNGVSFSVTDGKSVAKVQDMAISGSDLYLLITQENDSLLNAGIWKNGLLTKLYTGSGRFKDYAAFGEMAVDSSNVYVAATIPTTTGVHLAVYFKNGVITRLSDSTNGTFAVGICKVGKDIYVVGSTERGVQYMEGGFKATYWKNGTPVYLTDGKSYVEATSIKVIGTDVYVTGSESDGNLWVAKYWKNGVAVNLSKGPRGSSAHNMVIVQH